MIGGSLFDNVWDELSGIEALVCFNSPYLEGPVLPVFRILDAIDVIALHSDPKLNKRFYLPKGPSLWLFTVALGICARITSIAVS